MTSALDTACAFLADALNGGPRDAGEILAAAEGAKISERTMQRAAEQLHVVKSKAGLSAGWVWSMPSVESQSGNVLVRVDRARIIADRLRKLEGAKGRKAPIYPQDPRIQRWVQAGVSDPDLKEAYERATTDHSGMLTAGIMDRFIAQVMTEAVAC